MQETPRSSSSLLALLSLVLGGAALWFTWLRYAGLVNQTDSYWYNRVQLGGIALVGILCLWAGILFILGRPSAWAVFKLGLSIVPVILFTNLIVFLFRVMQNIFQGNANFLFERVFAEPHTLLFVLAVVITLAVLGSLNEKRGH